MILAILEIRGLCKIDAKVVRVAGRGIKVPVHRQYI